MVITTLTQVLKCYLEINKTERYIILFTILMFSFNYQHGTLSEESTMICETSTLTITQQGTPKNILLFLECLQKTEREFEWSQVFL